MICRLLTSNTDISLSINVVHKIVFVTTLSVTPEHFLSFIVDNIGQKTGNVFGVE